MNASIKPQHIMKVLAGALIYFSRFKVLTSASKISCTPSGHFFQVVTPLLKEGVFFLNPSNNPEVVFILCRWFQFTWRKQAQKNIFFKFFIKIYIFPFQNILSLFLFIKKTIIVADRGLMHLWTCPLRMQFVNVLPIGCTIKSHNAQ